MSVFVSLLRSGGNHLPSDYTAVTCLKNLTETSTYLSTNYDCVWNRKYEYDLQPVMRSHNWTSLGASTTNSEANRWGFNSEGKAPQASLLMRLGGASQQTNNISDLDNVRRTYTYIIENGYQVSSISGISTTLSTSQTGLATGKLVLFAHGTGGDRYRGRIYGLKISDTQNGKMIADMVPCVRKADNKPGMYDFVTKTFYSSATSTDYEYE